MVIGLILFNKLDTALAPFVYVNGEVSKETVISKLTKGNVLWFSNLSIADLRYSELGKFNAIKPSEFFGVSLQQMVLEQGADPFKLPDEAFCKILYPHLAKLVDMASRFIGYYKPDKAFSLFCSSKSFAQICHTTLYRAEFPKNEYERLTQKFTSYNEIMRPDIIHSRNILEEYGFLSVSFSRLVFARNIFSARVPTGSFERLSDQSDKAKEALLNETKPFIASLKNFSVKSDIAGGDLTSSLLGIESNDHYERGYFPSPEIKLLKNYADFELDEVFVSTGETSALKASLKQEVLDLLDSSPQWEAGVIAFNLWSSAAVEKFFTLPSKKTAKHTSYIGLWVAAFNKVLSFKLMLKAYETIKEKGVDDSGWVLFSYGRGEANFFVLNKEKSAFKSYFKSIGFTSTAEINLS